MYGLTSRGNSDKDIPYCKTFKCGFFRTAVLQLTRFQITQRIASRGLSAVAELLVI